MAEPFDLLCYHGTQQTLNILLNGITKMEFEKCANFTDLVILEFVILTWVVTAGSSVHMLIKQMWVVFKYWAKHSHISVLNTST